MNKIYRLVWNTVLGTWVVVSELARSLGRSTRLHGVKTTTKRMVWVSLAVMMTVVSNSVYATCTSLGAVTTCVRAAPTSGSSFLNGNAVYSSFSSESNGTLDNIQGSGGPVSFVMDVETTGDVVINWDKLSVIQNHTANFHQDGADAQTGALTNSTVLNQVKPEGGFSDISGQIYSNGNIAFINPNGIVMYGGLIDVGGFVASGLNLVNGSSLSNGLDFSGGSGSIDIQYRSSNIKIKNDKGTLALIGHTITNYGNLDSAQGGSRIILAAGSRVDGIGTDTMSVTASPEHSITNHAFLTNGRNNESIVLYGGKVLGDRVTVGDSGAINLVAGSLIEEKPSGLQVIADDPGHTVQSNGTISTGKNSVVRLYGYRSTNGASIFTNGSFDGTENDGGIFNMVAGTQISDADHAKTIHVVATQDNKATTHVGGIAADKGRISIIGGSVESSRWMYSYEGTINLLAGNQVRITADAVNIDDANKNNVVTNGAELDAPQGGIFMMGGKVENHEYIIGNELYLLAGTKISVAGGKATTVFTGSPAEIPDYGILNTGNISASNDHGQAGTIVLAGPTVHNDGSDIEADDGGGWVQIGAGGQVTAGVGGLEVTQADDIRYDISNDGLISASGGGGRVHMSANRVWQRAHVHASGGFGGNIDIHGMSHVLFSDQSVTNAQGQDGRPGQGELKVSLRDRGGQFTANGALSTDKLSIAADRLSYGGEKNSFITHSATFTHATDNDTLHVTKNPAEQGVSEEFINTVRGDRVVHVTLKGDAEIKGDEAGIDLVSKGNLSLEAGERGMTGNPLQLTADQDVRITSQGDVIVGPIKAGHDVSIDVTAASLTSKSSIEADHDVHINVNEDFTGTVIHAGNDLNVDVGETLNVDKATARQSIQLSAIGKNTTSEVTSEEGDVTLISRSDDVNFGKIQSQSVNLRAGKGIEGQNLIVEGTTSNDADLDKDSVQDMLSITTEEGVQLEQVMVAQGDVTLTIGQDLDAGDLQSVNGQVTVDVGGSLNADQITAQGNVALTAGENLHVKEVQSRQGQTVASAGGNFHADRIAAEKNVALTAGKNLYVKEVQSKQMQVTADAGRTLNIDNTLSKGDVQLSSIGKNTTAEVVSEEGHVLLISRGGDVEFGEIEGQHIGVEAGKNIRGQQITAKDGLSMDSGVDNIEVQNILPRPVQGHDLAGLVQLVERGEDLVQNVFDAETLSMLSQDQLSRLIKKDPEGVYALAHQLSGEQIQTLTSEQLDYYDRRDGRTLREKLGLSGGEYTERQHEHVDAQPLRVMDELDIMHREFHCPLVDGDPLELWTHYRNLGYCLYDSDIDFIEKPMVPTINVIAPPVVVEEPKPKACRRVLIDEEPKYRPAKKRKKRLVKRKRRSKKVTRARKGKRKVVRKRRRVMRAAPPAPRYKIVCD